MKWKLVPEEPTVEMREALVDNLSVSFIRTKRAYKAMLAVAPQPEHDRMTKEEAQAIQGWKGMDGAVAFHLIERHADGWEQIGAMMDAWLDVNRTPN